jgi:membrane-bound serine protease (ClpP class)
MIYFEFYLPGGVMGGTGALLILGALFLFIVESDSLLFTAIFFATAVVLVALTIKLALYRISRSDPKDGLYSFQDQEGFIASNWDRDAVGKRGVVSSDLKPGGHILLEGKRVQALSKSGYLQKGTTVEVIGGEGESLIVKLVKEEKE